MARDMQEEFRTNLLRYLRNVAREVDVSEIIPIYLLTYAQNRPVRVRDFVSQKLQSLEDAGAIVCSWERQHDTILVRTVRLRES